MPKASKPDVAPNTCVDHDREKFHIEVELPGASKEDIELEVGEQFFCIRAPTKDLVYNACHTLAHGVNTAKADAKFDNGLLVVNMPFKSKIGGKKIAIK